MRRAGSSPSRTAAVRMPGATSIQAHFLEAFLYVPVFWSSRPYVRVVSLSPPGCSVVRLV